MSAREGDLTSGKKGWAANAADPALSDGARGTLADPFALSTPSQLAAVLTRELHVCRRYGRRLGLLLVQARVLGGEHPDSPPLEERMESLQQAMGRRLVARVRGTDQVYRVGPQRFAVLLGDCGAAEVAIVQLRLHEVLNGPYGLDEHLLYVGLSMGSASFPQQGGSGTELVQRAEASLSWHLGPWADDRYRAGRIAPGGDAVPVNPN